MLPVSVLPVAGILLGVGSANFTWLPAVVSDVMAQAGGAIFGNLAADLRDRRRARPDRQRRRRGAGGGRRLRGDARDDGGDGAAVRLRADDRSWASRRSRPASSAASSIGAVAAMAVQPLLPDPAAAVSRLLRRQAVGADPHGARRGRRRHRAEPRVAADRPSQIDDFSRWAASENPALAFALYGVVERALIPFGLHHIWNVPFFFEVGQYVDPATGQVIRGEIHRFTAGDPTAGNLAGGYLFKMWGLPAAALAIWRTARPENRAKVGGIMISAALTSFLTGHHRADRVRVPVRRAAAVRHPRACSPGSRTSSASSSASSTARRSRTA